MSGTTKGSITKATTPTTKASVVAATPVTGPTQPVTITGYTPNTFDENSITTIGPLAAGDQPPFPTPWPPNPPAPSPSMASAGQIPWKQWVEVLAVRPYVTDPPPCPVVVSRYPGLTNN